MVATPEADCLSSNTDSRDTDLVILALKSHVLTETHSSCMLKRLSLANELLMSTINVIMLLIVLCDCLTRHSLSHNS